MSVRPPDPAERPVDPDHDSDSLLARLREANDPPPMGRLAGYELLYEVARGGQGVVYKAKRARDGRTVAIKRLHPHAVADPSSRRRLEREIEASLSLDHPCVVRTLERLDEQGLALVTEWIDGVDAATWADAPGEGERRSVGEVLGAFVRIGEGVRHAHQRGVIHRDIKPANVLVEPDGTPHVLDFGLAKRWPDAAGASEAHTATRSFVGTLAWAAPEQAEGRYREVDARTDVHALGLLLFRMLTGRSALATEGPALSVARSIAQDDAPRASSVRPEVPRDLDAIIGMALAKEPERRYQTVDAMLADVRRLLAGEAVEARGPGVAYRMRKLASRRRATAAALGVGSLALVAIAIGSTLVAGALAKDRNALRSARNEEANARRIAERTASFLEHVIGAAGAGRRGADATLLDALAEAAPLAAQLDDDPPVGARVQHTLGQTYRSLWMYDEAIPHLRRAADLSRSAYGERSADHVRSLVALGSCMANTSDPASVEVHERALRLAAELSPPDPALVAEATMRLGYARYRAADPPRFEQAERDLLEALDRYAALHDAPHRDTAACLHNLAYLRWRQDRVPEALETYRRSCEAYRAVGDLADPYYAECLYGYGSALTYAGRWEDAAAILDEASQRLADAFGQTYATRPLAALARTQAQRGDGPGSASAACCLLSIRLDAMGAESPSFANAASRLERAADLVRTRMDADACAGLIDELASLDAPRVRTLEGPLSLLADSLLAADHAGPALALHEHLDGVLAPPGTERTLLSLDTLEGRALCLVALDRTDEARELLEQAVAMRDRAVGPRGAARTAWLRLRLAACLERAGEHDRGATMRREAAGVLRAERGPDHPWTREGEAMGDAGAEGPKHPRQDSNLRPQL